MAKHTPGPWRTLLSSLPGFSRWVLAGGEASGYIAIAGVIASEGEDYEANAALIAAAPDLLAACRAVLIFHSGGEWTHNAEIDWIRITGKDDATTKVLCDTVRAAIAKAEAVNA